MTVMFSPEIHDLSAKNPNKAKGVVYKKPEELTAAILKKEKAITVLTEQVIDLLKNKGNMNYDG